MNTTALYLCYQSLQEPLTETQVVAYLEGLARGGYHIVLLTFESRRLSTEEATLQRQRMANLGIQWHYLRYHKRPTLLATGWDVACGIWIGLRLTSKHGVRLIHARSHVPGIMGLVLKWLTGAKLLFDVRGLMAEEYVDAGNWPRDGKLFRLVKRAERLLIRSADGFVVLTESGVELLREWYFREMAEKPTEAIPCCVDLERIPEPGSKPRRSSGETFTLAYVGKLGGWYLDEAMAAFVQEAYRMLPNLRWQIWSQSDPDQIRQLISTHGLDEVTTVGRCAPEDMAVKLSEADAGLSFIKPCLSKRASSPTKVAEYLAAGLPVVSTAGIGDLDILLAANDKRKPVGVLLPDLARSTFRTAIEELQDLVADPDTPARCRNVAEEHFDLQRVGWVRYRRIYAELVGHPVEVFKTDNQEHIEYSSPT